MISILVVDDEPRHRTGLAKMLRALRPGYSVLEARNGEDALRIMNTKHFAIIITDIKMPIVDGLQMIELMSEKIKDAKVIILSAYGYFEYAQKAISLGAFDYLLKPVDETRVLQMLCKAEAKIEEESRETREKELLKKQLDDTLPVYLEIQLNKWLKGRLGKGEMDEIENIFPFKGMGTVFITKMENYYEVFGEYTKTELDEVILNLKYWIREALASQGHSLSFFLQDDKTIMITLLNSSSKPDITSEKSLKELNEFINNLKIDYRINALIAIGNISANIFDEISTVYRHARTASDYGFFFETEKIITYSAVENLITKHPVGKFDVEKELSEAIRKLGKDEAVSIVCQMIRDMVKGGYPEPARLKDTLVHMLLNQLRIIQKIVNEEKFYLMADYISNDLKNCKGFHEFTVTVKQVVSNIIDVLNDQKNRKNDLIIKKCIEYIDRNFAEDLSLESVAETFYFNPSYFSTLFKNHTKINFSQYLLELRMKKGRELLEKTDLKVYEIAAAIGYNDSKYFNRVFKKEFGVTPDEYRRL